MDFNLIDDYVDLLFENKFITEKSKDITNDKLLQINKIINRTECLKNIDLVLQNIRKSNKLEVGIFEYTLIYQLNNNISENLTSAIYKDITDNILSNINPKSPLASKQLFQSIINDQINPQYIAFLSPDQLNPKLWKDIINKKNYEQYCEQNKAISNAYTCYKCGEKKCRVTQLQTRSADEPMTTFISCQVCFNTIKR